MDSYDIWKTTPPDNGAECPVCDTHLENDQDGDLYCPECKAQEALERFECPSCGGDLAICINTLQTACPDCGASYNIDQETVITHLQGRKAA